MYQDTPQAKCKLNRQQKSRFFFFLSYSLSNEDLFHHIRASQMSWPYHEGSQEALSPTYHFTPFQEERTGRSLLLWASTRGHLYVPGNGQTQRRSFEAGHEESLPGSGVWSRSRFREEPASIRPMCDDQSCCHRLQRMERREEKRGFGNEDTKKAPHPHSASVFQVCFSLPGVSRLPGSPLPHSGLCSRSSASPTARAN